MTQWERWLFNTFHFIVTISGVVYFYMKYAMTTDDPFAVINHPWQSDMLSIHLITAPFFLACFGMIFRSHTLRKILSPNPENRRTGWTSLISFSAMAISGYLIQIATTQALILAMVWLHIFTGTFFVIGYGIHLVLGFRLNKLQSQTADTSFSESARLSS